MHSAQRVSKSEHEEEIVQQLDDSNFIPKKIFVEDSNLSSIEVWSKEECNKYLTYCKQAIINERSSSNILTGNFKREKENSICSARHIAAQYTKILQVTLRERKKIESAQYNTRHIFYLCLGII